MKTIWKYPLKICEIQTIYLTAGATVLSVQMQNGVPCIWALVTPPEDAYNKDKVFPKDEFKILMFSTGNTIDREFAWNTQFLGTIQNNGIVFHVFYEEA